MPLNKFAKSEMRNRSKIGFFDQESRFGRHPQKRENFGEMTSVEGILKIVEMNYPAWVDSKLPHRKPAKSGTRIRGQNQLSPIKVED